MSEENTAQSAEQEVEKSLANQVKSFEGAPANDQIEAWKQEHGDVFASAFSDTELLMWRSVARVEFSELQNAAMQADPPLTQFQMEERLVRLCLLWASPDAMNALDKKAGSMTTLHEQILLNSNFMDPRLAATLVTKL